jgi:uncharacterized protein with GYD domain
MLELLDPFRQKVEIRCGASSQQGASYANARSAEPLPCRCAGSLACVDPIFSEAAMSKYLFEATYSAVGAKGLVHDGGTGRQASVEKAIKGLGGKLESFYYAFGDVDAYVIADLPNHETAAALALAVNQSGAASVKTIVLMTVKEVDKAAKKAVKYRPPGG